MEHKKDIFYKTNERALSSQAPTLGGSVTEHGDGKRSDLGEQAKAGIGAQPDFSVFLSKKTEKIAAALYMVTSFLSDNEPLKWKLRDRGVSLLSDISAARNGSVSEVENIFADYSCKVEEIISFLEIGAAAKLISEMNFSILKKEYLSLKTLIDSDEHSEKRIGRFIFPNDFFLGTQKLEDAAQAPEALSGNHASKGNVSDNTEADQGHVRNGGQAQSVEMPAAISNGQKYVSGIGHTPRTRNDRKDTKRDKVSKIDRRNAVLKLFKKNKEMTIKDISHAISGCSEKTVQRELLSLVSEGVLNKTGERRWSRYSLK